MNKFLVIQVIVFLLIAGSLGGMLAYTDIYDDVQSGIVETICLSCAKLDTSLPVKFTFTTANGKPHPDFIIDILKDRGPILIQYGEKACAACEDMINNIIKPYFNLQFDKTISFDVDVNMHGLNFTYVYIYIDDPATPQERVDSYDVYDSEHIRGFPMFTIITIEYDHSGKIEPFYASLYGKFEPNDDYEKMTETFTELIKNCEELWARNLPGFEK
ncbi:hypothetical protein AYK24_05165 [Thermoplasmatales archaeon SG8-52-4]|nr:MAG: hypothetical protein AYK24_05165 [Thermoplasmatales archaeon SG8-52-4]